jgi:hypothetical protein
MKTGKLDLTSLDVPYFVDLTLELYLIIRQNKKGFEKLKANESNCELNQLFNYPERNYLK